MIRGILLAFTFAVLSAARTLADTCSPTMPSSSPDSVENSPGRRIVIISDLHLGVGRDPDGKWDNLEDGRWAGEFALFLKKIDQNGNGTTNLILNGDTFELWQSLEHDCIHTNRNLGCTEEEELRRLNRVTSQHRSELASLKSFAESGSNRVIIVPGNHDAGLMYPAVQTALLTVLGAKRGTVRIATSGYWLSPGGFVYADHGQQIGNDSNRFDCWPNAFIDQDGIRYLQRPWGEQFVQLFYNERENRFPIIDNLSDSALAIRLAAKAEGAATASEAAQFAQFFLLQVSWNQFVQSLGKGKVSRWDVKAMQDEGDKFIVDSFAPDDPLLPAISAAQASVTLSVHTANLSPDEIIAICDQRAFTRSQEEAAGRCKKASDCITGCKPVAAGASTEALFRLRTKHLREYLERRTQALREENVATQNFRIYVYSHTHIAEPPHGLTGFKRPWDLTIVNTGAWQRVATNEQLNQIKSCKGLADEQVLALLPEDLPSCYSAVTIDPPYNEHSTHLLYWEEDRPGHWSLESQCKWQCASPTKQTGR